MVHQPLVTIGLPVYNGEKYLGQALDSLLSQTYQRLEVLIFDNASNDGTQRIGELYAKKDPRVRYIRNERNLGASRNYNLGIEHANGTYFKWAAYDDVCRPAFVERCVELLESNPRVVLTYPKTIIIDEVGNTIDEEFEDKYSLRDEKPRQRYKHFCKAPLDCNPVFGVMRLDILRKTPGIGPFESSDRVLLGELALLGEIAEVPERLFLRRYHPEISTTALKTKKDMAAWFDPASDGKFTRLRRFAEYFRSIYRVPLPFSQRCSCVWNLLGFYARFYLQPRRWASVISRLVEKPPGQTNHLQYRL